MPFKQSEAKHAYARKYYRENRQKHIVQAMVRRAKRQKEIVQWIAEFKAGKACPRCGESHPACLDFHHTRDKIVDISRARVKGWSKKRLMQEIAKCEIICANCHRKEHARLK